MNVGKKFYFIIGLLIVACIISASFAETTANKTSSVKSVAVSAKNLSATTEMEKNNQMQMGYVCNQPYAICDTAICVPDKNDPTLMRCSCSVENGSSIGGACSSWEPVGIYMNDDGEWMIQAGYSVGQVTSTFSFAHAAPVQGNEIDPNNTPSDYQGDVYMKSCSNASGDGIFADCWNAPCTVLPKDINADINTDRPASPYAVCDCGLELNNSEWYVGVHGGDKCNNESYCKDFIISAGQKHSTDLGIQKLGNYLADNPGVDPSQPYKIEYCKNCTDCS